MNKFIINTFDYFKFNSGTKLFLSNNHYLFEDNEYIKKIFEKNCLESNLEIVNFLYEKNIFENQLYLPNTYYQELFGEMCLSSNLVTITWFYEKFTEKITDKIGSEEQRYLLNSTYNYDFEVTKFIISHYKYSSELYEFIFEKSVSRLNIRLAKLIYYSISGINLWVLNGVNLYNSLDIRTVSNMILWLKTICAEQSYIIQIINAYSVVLIDELYISNEQVNLDLSDKTNRLDFGPNSNSDYSYDNQDNKECVLCLELVPNIMLNCSHKFCSCCLRKWFKKNRSCPTCRNNKDVKGFILKSNKQQI